MEAHFTAGSARRIVGVSQRCLDYWDETGIVRPSCTPAKGRGSERRYSFHDLLKLSVVKHLREAGLSLQRIRKGLRVLGCKVGGDDALLRRRLYTDGKTLHRLTDDPRYLEDVLGRGQLVLSVVAIGRIEAELKDRIVHLDTSGRLRGRGRPAIGTSKQKMVGLG